MTDPFEPTPVEPDPHPDAPLPPPPVASRPPAVLTPWIVASLLVLLALSTFVAGGILGRAGLLGDALGSTTGTGTSKELALVDEAWRTLHDHYVDAKGLDDQALAYAAIRAMTDAVGDPGHTSFLTAAEAKAFDQSLSGTFVGIGVQVATDASGVVITAVLPHTPAQEAGLHRGDRIVAVDGHDTTGLTIDTVVGWVRGPEGESVRLTVNRAGSPQFDVSIVRRKLDRSVVSWAMVPGRSIALLRLDQFSSGSAKEVKDALTSALAAGATAIVLDLRGNGGGYVSEAVGVGSQFIADGALYQSIDASGAEHDVKVEAGGLATTIPLVVLADGQTASAAEIVSGAIQDAGRGKVVGQKTFGTGTVTGRYDLADGSSLRIGTERWLTRGGRPIWHEGLEPDMSVALDSSAQMVLPDDLTGMTAAQLGTSTDAQLLMALQLLAGKG